VNLFTFTWIRDEEGSKDIVKEPLRQGPSIVQGKSSKRRNYSSTKVVLYQCLVVIVLRSVTVDGEVFVWDVSRVSCRLLHVGCSISHQNKCTINKILSSVFDTSPSVRLRSVSRTE